MTLPKKAAKFSPKKQNTDSKALLEDNFEDEMEGIQQFLNKTSEKSPNNQSDVIDDEFEPAAENIPSNYIMTTNVSKPATTPTKTFVVKKETKPNGLSPIFRDPARPSRAPNSGLGSNFVKKNVKNEVVGLWAAPLGLSEVVGVGGVVVLGAKIPPGQGPAKNKFKPSEKFPTKR
jgi:hypothetical protein